MSGTSAHRTYGTRGRQSTGPTLEDRKRVRYVLIWTSPPTWYGRGTDVVWFFGRPQRVSSHDIEGAGRKRLLLAGPGSGPERLGSSDSGSLAKCARRRGFRDGSGRGGGWVSRPGSGETDRYTRSGLTTGRRAGAGDNWSAVSRGQWPGSGPWPCVKSRSRSSACCSSGRWQAKLWKIMSAMPEGTVSHSP